jgi:hypothetical protein
LLVNIKFRTETNIIVEEVVWLLEHDYILTDADDETKVYGTVGELYRGDKVIVETCDGIFGIKPTSIISIEEFILPEEQQA